MAKCLRKEMEQGYVQTRIEMGPVDQKYTSVHYTIAETKGDAKVDMRSVFCDGNGQCTLLI